MATTNFQKGIDELLNRLDEEETDISKICEVRVNGNVGLILSTTKKMAKF